MRKFSALWLSRGAQIKRDDKNGSKMKGRKKKNAHDRNEHISAWRLAYKCAFKSSSMVSRIQSVIHALRYCSLHRIQSSFKFKCDRTMHVTIVVVRCFSLSLCSACVCVCAFRAPPNDCQPCLHTQHTKRFILYTRAHSDSKRSLGDGSSTGKNICVEVRRRRVAPAMSQPNEKLCTTKTQMLFLAFRSNGI